MVDDGRHEQDPLSDAFMGMFGKEEEIPIKPNKDELEDIKQESTQEEKVPEPVQKAFSEWVNATYKEAKLIKARPDKLFCCLVHEEGMALRDYYVPVPNIDGITFKRKESIEILEHSDGSTTISILDQETDTNRPEAEIYFPESGNLLDGDSNIVLAFPVPKDILTVSCDYGDDSFINDIHFWASGSDLKDKLSVDSSITIAFVAGRDSYPTESSNDDFTIVRDRFVDKENNRWYSFEIKYKGKEDWGVLVVPGVVCNGEDVTFVDPATLEGGLDDSDEALKLDEKWRKANVSELTGIRLLSKEEFLKHLATLDH